MPAMTEPHPPALAQRVLREQVATVHANAPAAYLADFLTAQTLGIGLFVATRRWQVLLWMALHLALTLRRAYRRYQRTPDAAAHPEYWARFNARNVLMRSCVWGLAPWLCVPPGRNLGLWVMVIVMMMGGCAGGALSLAVLKRNIPRFIVPSMASLTLALAWRGDTVHLFLATGCLLYMGVMIIFALQHHRLLTAALTMRFEKEALAEQLSHQIAATQRASEEKTRFLAAASHDLRQPLHAIALFGAVIEKKLQGSDEWNHAARLMDAVGTLGDSLDTLLDISRLDAGEVSPQIRPVELNPLFLALNNVFAAQAADRDLQLRLRATPCWVLSDPQLLQRLLSNLVDNALKYTVRGGVVVAARARGPLVWIDVCDTGIGIPHEHLGRIFDEFYQVGNPGRDRAQGLGIGLSIVHRLSRLMAHPLQVRSRLDHGSRFRLVLPAVSASGVAPLAVRPDAALPLPQRVLLIDDEAAIRQAVTGLLQAHGVRIDAVASEAEAEAVLAQAAHASAPVEVLLCDVRLADGGDGLAAAQRLCARFGPGLQALLITGETAPQRQQQMRESGLQVLLKPVAADRLLQTLASLTGHDATHAGMRA
ncbi:signal transduction histidine kinase/ActR/RegA family two-component response regulator [Variovorax boronicumulans]|uniref:histidine kinase n=1 Tax=Variovorax boronicumulans TaxID=436515 RepID=A0AAW8DY60_9BURK|nr:hybrid sensor histidine kinase/response regulator [Variovorax boronicumulans]MDP9879199.1 signal transduction histidine kinase/ActR/RegA family two-component response regulator [Variovorax boronicumulans]MDP9924483.1 signal transduction histidine kinase/ActR/RegA family two-component response regulator [Variovorax boronicumulans]